MDWFHLQLGTIPALTQFTLVLCITLYLLSRRNKTRATWMLVCMFSAVTFAVLVSDDIINTVNVPLPLLIRWGDSFAGSIIVFALLHFAYAFLGNPYPREARMAFWLTSVLLLGIILFVSIQLIVRTSLPDTFELLYEGLNVSMIVWATGVFVRKKNLVSTDFVPPGNRSGVDSRADSGQSAVPRIASIASRLFQAEGEEARALRAFAGFTLAILPFTLHTWWAILGDPPPFTFAIKGLGFGLVLIAFVVLYINHAPEPTTVQVKLIGLSLATTLLVLGIAAPVVYPEAELVRESQARLPTLKSLRFVPEGAQNYRMAQLPLRVDADRGEDLDLAIEGDTLVTLDFAFPFYGTRYTQMFVDANGLVSFEGPYLSTRLQDFYENELPKIAPYYRALNPNTSDQSGIFYKHAADKATVTWYRVHEYLGDDPTNLNTFQLVLHHDGTIDFVYDRMEARPFNGNRGLRPGGTGLAVEWGRFAEPPTKTVAETLLPEGQTIRFEPDSELGYRFTSFPSRFEEDLGEAVGFRGDDEATVGLGFAFPFFEERWEAVHVCVSGAAAFGAPIHLPGLSYFSPVDSRFDTLPMIAPLFIDLTRAHEGNVFYRTTADKATTTWYRMRSSDPPQVNTVQLVLHKSGSIDFTYEQVGVPVFAAHRWGLYAGDDRPAVDAVRYLMETNSYAGTAGVILAEHFGLYSQLIYRRLVHDKMVPFVYVVLASTLFILVVFPLLFRVSLIRPLAVLLRGVRQVDEGDLDARVPVRVNDEIGVLSGAFNRMITSLRTARSKLTDYAADLEVLKDRLQAENTYLQDEIKLQHNFEDIITRSDVLERVLRSIEQVAVTDATVLITGESGTGKELLARAIHQLSSRGDRPLVKVNCATLPSELIESELFGHEKGAFTGAIAKKIGRFELADRGTIFLDEIGDLPLGLQAKLLRVLQEGEFERLGSPNTITVDARVIAATNRDLVTEKDDGRFREDLYYRLCVFPIESPPLRARKEDIPLLVTHFVRTYSKKVGKQIEAIPQSVIDTLQAYHWPGNVRELENVIERAVIVSPDKKLVLGDWLPKAATASDGEPVCTLEENERRHILKTLELTGGRVSGEKGAARLLGINPNTLTSRMKKLGIQRKT